MFFGITWLNIRCGKVRVEGAKTIGPLGPLISTNFVVVRLASRIGDAQQLLYHDLVSRCTQAITITPINILRLLVLRQNATHNRFALSNTDRRCS